MQTSITADHKYPLFVPPLTLAGKDRKAWSAVEAKEYFTWLVTVAPSRVDHLLNFLNIARLPLNGELLDIAQVRLESSLSEGGFYRTESERRRLTDAGYAIAADMGLLVATIAIASSSGKVKWETLRKPKSDASFNLPILKGFENDSVHFDPIQGSIACLAGIVNGKALPQAWRRGLNFCLDNG